ncbi:aldo/keto reductase [Streptomyces rhizosphaericus]|uniref:aldo/keto reductase n=1 Tax=Streptomyces rhizosphaericus TaxID=114699 RepID=UPI000A3C2E02|nr:aldo/keto reductase [Streptomyces rhizosphaericus]
MTPSDLSPRRLAEGLMVRPLGLGSGTSRWAPHAAQPDDAHLLDELRHAVVAGLDEDDAALLDTADSYRCGHAEQLIGKVLRECPGHNVQVASKVGRIRGSAPHPYAGPRVRHQLEQTLENLYLDELAVYTLESYDFGPGDRYLDPVIEQMRALRDLGQIRAVGLRGPGFRSSPRSIRRFRDLFDLIRPDVVWTQASGLLPLADLGDGEDLGAFTTRRGVGLVIASPLAHGALAGGCPDRALAAWGGLEGDQAQAVRLAITSGLVELAGRFGPNADVLARVALRFILQRVKNAVVVVGVGGGHRGQDDLSFLGRPLSDHDLVVVEEVFARVRDVLIQIKGGTPSVEVNTWPDAVGRATQRPTPLRR